jgi:hypothetical protein
MLPLAIRTFIVIGLFLPGWVYCSATAVSAQTDSSTNTCASADCRPKQKSKEKNLKAVFLGHNASPSSYALSAGQVTAGNFGIAVGITDHITIATSPWLWASYEAANIHVKWVAERDNGFRVGALVSYFETFGDSPFLRCIGAWEGWMCPNQSPEIVDLRRQANPVGYKLTEAISAFPNRYQFQTVASHFLYGIDSDRQSYHLNLKFSYFFNDDRAYSIRVDPGTDAIRGQVDATVLLEHRVNSYFRLNFEAGALGLNAIVPSGHLGFSAAWANQFWLAQVGASATWMLPSTGPRMIENLGASEERFHTAKDGQFYYGGRYYQTSVHPEFQLQYFF